ncbi:hypothetical protein E2562_016473 [Oryza meyeriana var. granulata]|uniref:Uncharacterized protein n=1 Tax=Oryza meyeriana var. granulata TaxID=110450 RepID=A0A6G1BLC7_9ORYZ|nr:hypothetical protein E2562_016473 [Oryza meyeriana var. granulata]
MEIDFATPPVDATEGLVANHDKSAPLRFRAIDNVLGPTSVPGLAEHELATHLRDLLLTSAEEPASFREAKLDQSWRRAMIDEMESIEANHTWELVDPPTG